MLSMICGIIIMQINHHFSYQEKSSCGKMNVIRCFLEFSGFSPIMCKGFERFGNRPQQLCVTGHWCHWPPILLCWEEERDSVAEDAQEDPPWYVCKENREEEEPSQSLGCWVSRPLFGSLGSFSEGVSRLQPMTWVSLWILSVKWKKMIWVYEDHNLFFFFFLAKMLIWF